MASTDKNADKKLPNKESALFRSIVVSHSFVVGVSGGRVPNHFLGVLPSAMLRDEAVQERSESCRPDPKEVPRARRDAIDEGIDS